MILLFDVTNQRLERKDSNKLVDWSNNYVNASFTFKTEDWNGLTCFALFRDGRACYKVAVSDGSCLVPHEVLEDNYSFTVSLYGVDANDVRITTNQVKVYLDSSGYCKTAEESEIESNPTLVEDIYIKLNNTVQMDIVFDDDTTASYNVVVK